MSKNRQPPPSDSSSKSSSDVSVAKYVLIGTFITALFGVIGIGVNAYSTYLGTQALIKEPIRATQTAQANATALAALATSTVDSVIITTDIPVLPIDTPTLVAPTNTPTPELATDTPIPTNSPTYTPSPTSTPSCGRITSPLGLRGTPAIPDNIPHYSRTVEVKWESPPDCKIIVEFLQNQTRVYIYIEPILTGRTDMIHIPVGWTEIKTWVPGDTSGLPVDDIHVILCDPAVDAECLAN